MDKSLSVKIHHFSIILRQNLSKLPLLPDGTERQPRNLVCSSHRRGVPLGGGEPGTDSRRVPVSLVLSPPGPPARCPGLPRLPAFGAHYIVLPTSL